MSQQPGSLGNLMPPGPDWISRKFDAMQRQIDAITSTNTLAAAELGSGSGITVKGGAITLEDSDGNVLSTLNSDGLTLKDSDGNILATLNAAGLTIPNGGSVTVENGGGVAIEDGGTLTQENSSGDTMSLSQLAFGLTAAETSTATVPTTLDTWLALGPNVTFDVVTGRVLVIIGCQLTPGFSGITTGDFFSKGWMGYTLSGPDDVDADESRSVFESYGTVDADATVITYPLTTVHVHTGLTAGSYTAKSQYKTSTVSSNYVQYESRLIAVLPF